MRVSECCLFVVTKVHFCYDRKEMYEYLPGWFAAEPKHLSVW